MSPGQQQLFVIALVGLAAFAGVFLYLAVRALIDRFYTWRNGRRLRQAKRADTRWVNSQFRAIVADEAGWAARVEEREGKRWTP